MKCEKCGAVLPSEALFCPDCGCPVPKTEDKTEVIEKTEEPVVEETDAKPEEPAISEAIPASEEVTTDKEESNTSEPESPLPGAPIVAEQPTQPANEETTTSDLRFAPKDYMAANTPVVAPENPTPASTTPAPVAPTPEATKKAPKKEKVKKEKNTEKKKGGAAKVVVPIIIVLVLLAGVGGFYWFWMNRPIAKINKALETNDISTVASLYPELTKDEEKTEVQNAVLSYCQSQTSAFEEEDIDYKELSSLYKTADKILKGNKKYDSLVEDASALNDSRDAYAAAEKLFKKEDYEAAMEKYAEVIKADDNYKDAQAKIKECEANLIPSIAGTWVHTLNLGPYLADYASLYDSSYDYTFNMDMIMEFDEDGAGSVRISCDDPEGEFDVLAKQLAVYTVDNLFLVYYTEEELVLECQLEGMDDVETIDDVYDAFAEQLSETMDVDDLLEVFASSNKDFFYTATETEITVIGGSQISYYMEDDDLMLDLGDSGLTDFDYESSDTVWRFVKVD